ncbi:GNAT family N-acetyltransferase [Cellulomonas sp. NS3]|uniref:GNAT family N-acetyltransferase n=1 Tax=Cellulomonas sp. NS3 TaxID=2973977 RepID=UPI0021627289|nr:GNAT family N-acetyltransferase [Cellulomonas sp. NS3]
MDVSEPATPLLPERASVRAAAHLLSSALRGDPAFSHVLPEPRVRRRALDAIHRIGLTDGLRHGHVLGVHDDAGVAGVAVWYPPGAYPMTALRKLRTLAPLVPVALRHPLRTAALARFGSAVEAGLLDAVPPEGAWYLEVLGVRPDAQRRGHGRRLVEPVLSRADRTGTACYLETSREENVRYYEGFGFRVVGEVTALRPHGPVEAQMLRQPHGR